MAPLSPDFAALNPGFACCARGGQRPMQPHFAELFGIAAAASSLFAAQSKTMIPLLVATIFMRTDPANDLESYWVMG
jgi:hypothetical protein